MNIAEIHPSDDSQVFAYWLSDYVAGSITAADEFKVFDAIGNGYRSPAALSTELRVGQGAVEALCLVLCSAGFLKRDYDGFELTRVSRDYWLTGSPLYRG